MARSTVRVLATHISASMGRARGLQLAYNQPRMAEAYNTHIRTYCVSFSISVLITDTGHICVHWEDHTEAVLIAILAH